jgi:hypothetical protein
MVGHGPWLIGRLSYEAPQAALLRCFLDRALEKGGGTNPRADVPLDWLGGIILYVEAGSLPS